MKEIEKKQKYKNWGTEIWKCFPGNIQQADNRAEAQIPVCRHSAQGSFHDALAKMAEM